MYKAIIFGITLVIVLTSQFVISQNANKSRLKGTYYSSSGGQSPHSMVEREEPVCLNPPKCDSVGATTIRMHIWNDPVPVGYYKLRLKSWGRYTYKEKEPNVRYSKYFLFIKIRTQQLTLRGRWDFNNDSLYLKTHFDSDQKVFYCRFDRSHRSRSGSTEYYYNLVGRQKVFSPYRNH